MGAFLAILLTYSDLLWVAAAAYFCGCFNGAVIVSKYILRDDVRDHGSGNAGLTNFYRTFGGKLTLVVILCDVLKAVIAIRVGVWFGARFDPRIMPDVPLTAEQAAHYLILFTYWAGLWCLLGHVFPCMFGFKGGKGILSGGTIAIMIDWRLALLVWGGFLILAVLTRYVSLGSVFAAAAFPVGTWLFVSHNLIIMVLALLLGGLVLYMHRSNIHRLLTGTESKFSLHHKKEGKK